MNKLKKYIYIICMYLLLAGCTKEFVDLQNPTIASPESVYSTLTGIESSLPGIYYQGRAYASWESGSTYKNGPDDLCRAGIRMADEISPKYYSVYTFTSFDAENDFIKKVWENFYLGIHKCNLAMYSVDNIKLDESDPSMVARKNAVKGVLYFFRAYFHLQLVQRWDNIVLADHLYSNPSEVVKLSSKDSVYNLIISDLEKAIPLLPESNSITANKGQVTKGVARIALAKACMDIENWTKAAAAADSVINDGAYGLVGLDTVFNCHFRDNKEFIFSWQFKKGEKDIPGTSMPCRFLPMYDRVRGVARSFKYGGRPYNRLVPSDYYFSLFDKLNDKRYKAWHTLYYIYDTIGSGTKNTEVPSAGVQLGDTVTDANNVNPEQPGNEYICPTTNKWYEDETFGRLIGDAYGYGSILQYRLAEAYLIAGEAYFHLGNNGLAADRLNALRDRAGVARFNPGDINIQTILDEHGREMGQEGNRYEMLKRLGVLKEQVKLGNPAVGNVMQDFHVRWPIPYAFQKMTKVPQNKDYY